MFALVITGPDELHERHTYAHDEVSIGRAPINDLVLDHPSIANFHVRLLADARGFQIESCEQPMAWPSIVIRIDDQPVSDPCPVGFGQRIALGDLVIVIEPVAVEVSLAPDPIEAGLIQAIETERDVASREVYADWLEEHGQPSRAEFVRLELRAVQLASHSYDLAQVRLRELATAIDPRWRLRLACPRIRCREEACPEHWGSLEPTGDDALRRCGTCEKLVHYCFSTQESQASVAELTVHDLLFDAEVVRDPVSGRVWRCGTCGLDLRNVNRSPLDPTCPRCGGTVS